MEEVCPLPVDWLDYLDGVESPATAEHLADCLSCQQVVQNLQKDQPMPAARTDWLRDLDSIAMGAWKEERRASAKTGQIWLTAGSFAEASFSYENQPRIPVLILNESHRSDGRWLDVVPAWIDDVSRSSAMVRLAEHETDLGARMSLLFDLQGLVAQRQLESYVGTLTPAGESTVAAVMAGVIDEARLGVALPGVDYLFWEPSWLVSAIRKVQSFYWYFRENRMPDVVAQPKRLALPMIFHEPSAWSSERSWAFAASVGPPHSPGKEVRLDIDDIFLAGRLRHDLLGGDKLILRIEEARGFVHAIRIAVQSKRGEFVTNAIVATPGADVVLTEGRDLFLNDVEGVSVLVD